MQINSINSYSNYANTFNSQTKTQNLNENSTQTNALNSSISTLVQDKNKAVSQVLGYGVDEEGFFTSDFNEAAGLPKDYKIYAKGTENFVNSITSLEKNPTGRAFTSIDLAKSLGRAYQVFSQLISNVEGNFTKEDIDKIPQWFEWDTQSLQVNKIYTKDEYLNITPSKESAYSSSKHALSFASWDKLGLDFVDKSEDIFASHYGDIGKSIYTHTDKSISKGGVLMAFFTRNADFLRGETTVFGKMTGVDDDFGVSQRKELDEFMQNNPITYTLNENVAGEILKRFTLKSAYTDIEDFKNEWLKLKAESDKAYTTMQNEKLNSQALNNTNNFLAQNNDSSQSDETNKTTFTPIQAESKNETYKAIDTNELLKKLLEESFDEKDFLKMLFGIKDENVNLKSLDLNSNEFLNSNDLVSMLSKISLNAFNVLNKSVDMKV
ncbi:hypothetical protein DMB95_07035 [Campylobacter sp. MIT 12-8780]|uniref:Cj0814 family flagellar-dependent secreted protein n=2 Tax=unclassified Campylobacter TaxID=2593542 RepID=UPI00115F3ED0|nr:hypothetical protein [Campylobacter sp. MIT 12-8780]TQR40580.1 hypothetical protein DMB95_07035 [Campylobacter sp. MIT 12-8780]